MRRPVVLLLGTLAAAPLAGQITDVDVVRTGARSGVVFDNYALSRGLAFDRITELVIPVSLVQRVGNRVVLDLATAYAHAAVRTVDGDIELSGPVDTEVRAALSLIPGRMMLTVTATLPTGQATVPDTTLPLYGATATDLFGFLVPAFGSGGGVTAGLATGFPLGRSWATGVGASYRCSRTYVPVEGGGHLTPGAEARVRVGIEGPLGGRAYVRGALVYTRSAGDEMAGGGEMLVGDRMLGYVALNAAVGRGALSLYGWDMWRLHPPPSSAVRVPGGNVLTLGARLDQPVSPTVSLAPSVEVRHELSGLDTLAVLGWLARPGIEMRWRVARALALVTTAQYAFGQVRDEGVTVSVSGPRLGVVFEWAR